MAAGCRCSGAVWATEHSRFSTTKGDYTKRPKLADCAASGAGFPNGYVQTADDGLVYASGYAVLTLGASGGKAEYYQVNSMATSRVRPSELLWTDELGSH